MRQTEADIFQPSVGILLNKKKGCIVIADELIGYQSSDVEKKTLSHRKRGKNGPVADCVADSPIIVLFGMRLHACGESK